MIATALAHVSQPAPPLPESVPEPLRTTVMAGLAKDPSARPESAAAFADALRLPAGVPPEHLIAGAESAVAPVVVGIHATTPEPGGHTQFVTLSPNTPPAPAVVPKGSRGRGGRPAWLLPVAAATAALVLVIVIVMTAGGGCAQRAAAWSAVQDPSGALHLRRTGHHVVTAPPQLLGGRYEVGGLLGRGGMAEVHLGHDTRLSRPVAIKMLRTDLRATRRSSPGSGARRSRRPG